MLPFVLPAIAGLAFLFKKSTATPAPPREEIPKMPGSSPSRAAAMSQPTTITAPITKIAGIAVTPLMLIGIGVGVYLIMSNNKRRRR